MIILKTNRELELTFGRLIQTMGVPVEWTKYFVVIGDYLILQGRVRSLFFNFENRKVLTNIIDIPVEENQVVEITNDSKVTNVLNMVLYAFGKWGMLHGLKKVEMDFAQLNDLFDSIMKEFHVESGYTRESFRFYREGKRLNYEDVIQFAIESTKEKIEEEMAEDEESTGLWHNLIWKKKTAPFIKTETTFEERQSKRLGNNFYMVGYMCPECRQNLHTVVFPETKEFRIETNEGAVLLARAYTCENCHSFYTPRPKKLLIEGDVYDVQFLNDVRAYEDYIELLGNKGDRVSNYNFNEFESERGRRTAAEASGAIEKLCDNIEDLSREELFRLENMMEEGYYPSASVKRFEEKVIAESSRRKGNPIPTPKGKTAESDVSVTLEEELESQQIEDGETSNRPQAVKTEEVQEKESEVKEPEVKEPKKKEPKVKVTPAEQAAAKRRYEAKFGVLDRLSFPQMKELRMQLEKEYKLAPEDKAEFLAQLSAKEEQKRIDNIRQRAADGERAANYAQVNKIIRELEQENIEPGLKREILEPLYARRQIKAETEVAQMMTKMPPTLDRNGYQAFCKKLDNYPEADLSEYEQKLNAARDAAESNEIAAMVKHARMTSRQDLTDLLDKLNHQGFSEEVLSPYREKIQDKIRAVDEESIAQICDNMMQMTADETMEAYQKIENGMFLPELKTHALEMLNKRLVKIKSDECELLVNKLKNSMTEKMQNLPRHHFYPARKVMMHEETEAEMAQIRYALDTYGTTRNLFEYPILVVDSSRNESGKEGIILTPEHLFYNTMMNAYAIPIGDIKSLKTSTGLLNSGVIIELKNGTKTKIPYAVDKQELPAWGVVLRDFIKYLQERPDSRKVTYLAKEKHETICCFRCGYMYKGGQTCPKCGYKMNQ